MSEKFPIQKTEAEWKKELSPLAYHVLREHGTEPPFRNEYNDNKAKGIYHCAACGATLFTSDTKYESGSGWPSFYAPISPESIGENEDRRHSMVRIEVH